jgi:type II secretory pathway pseudopilin PulG
MQDREPSGSTAGFTVVEVIVSFVILATVLGSVAISLASSARLHRASEAKKQAQACAERILAEQFATKAGLPSVESGAESSCRWRLSRRVVKLASIAAPRNLVSFRLEILDPTERVIEAFESYYVESSP